LGGCRCCSVDPETHLLSRALPSRLAEVEQHKSRGGDWWVMLTMSELMESQGALHKQTE